MLPGWNYIGEWGLFAEPRDGVATRLIAVPQQFFAILGCGRQYGHRPADHVAYGVTNAPPTAAPRAGVGHFSSQVLTLFGEFVNGVELGRGVAVERGFGEE